MFCVSDKHIGTNENKFIAFDILTTKKWSFQSRLVCLLTISKFKQQILFPLEINAEVTKMVSKGKKKNFYLVKRLLDASLYNHGSVNVTHICQSLSLNQ